MLLVLVKKKMTQGCGCTRR